MEMGVRRTHVPMIRAVSMPNAKPLAIVTFANVHQDIQEILLFVVRRTLVSVILAVSMPNATPLAIVLFANVYPDIMETLLFGVNNITTMTISRIPPISIIQLIPKYLKYKIFLLESFT